MNFEWTLHYAPLKVTDLWENQPAAKGTDWKAFKDEIYELYPGSQSERKYNIVNLEAVTDKQWHAHTYGKRRAVRRILP